MSNDVRATIRLFNYRCFGDANPGLIELRPGFTGYVGTNNSGKSTLLRAIRELKPLFALLGDRNTVQNILAGTVWNCSFIDTEDPLEIAHDRNSGPVIVDISFPVASEDELSRLQFAWDRARQTWSARIWHGVDQIELDREHVRQFGLVCKNAAGGLMGISTVRAEQVARIIGNSIYIPAFRHAMAGATGSTGGDLLTGSEFHSHWGAWQAGPIKTQRQRIRRVVEDIESLFDLVGLQLQVAPGSSAIQVFVSGKDYRLREMGAGLTQFLLVLATVAIKQPSLVLIDEPEINLHPSLQQQFLRAVASYASYGVLFASHSLGLARTGADQLYSVRRSDGVSGVHVWDSTPKVAEILGELNYASFREIGHERIVVVEGMQDVRPVKELLRLLRLEMSTLVIPIGGDEIQSDAATTTVSELQRLTGKLHVLLDSERSAEGEPPKAGRQEFVEQCRVLKVPVHLTTRRALENYFTDRAVKAGLGPEHSAIGPYQRLKEAVVPWSKRDNWRAARELTIDELEGTDLLHFLRNL